MSDIKRKSAYEVGQYFLHNKKRRIFKVVNREWKDRLNRPSTSKVKNRTQDIKDWLYDIHYITGTPQEEEYGRYYESRLTKECELITDQELIRLVYE